MKIFCIGLPRTGTTSFATIMNKLSFRHKGNHSKLHKAYNNNDLELIYSFIDTAGYDSFDDHPWSDMWKELSIQYPDAKFINLVRNPKDWRRSMMKMASNTVKTVDEIKTKAPWRIKVFQEFLDDPSGGWFIVRNKEIADHFNNNPNFIELNWNYDDYTTLCRFLNIELPNIEMPKVDQFPKIKTSGLKNILENFNQEEKTLILKELK